MPYFRSSRHPARGSNSHPRDGEPLTPSTKPAGRLSSLSSRITVSRHLDDLSARPDRSSTCGPPQKAARALTVKGSLEGRTQLFRPGRCGVPASWHERPPCGKPSGLQKGPCLCSWPLPELVTTGRNSVGEVGELVVCDAALHVASASVADRSMQFVKSLVAHPTAPVPSPCEMCAFSWCKPWPGSVLETVMFVFFCCTTNCHKLSSSMQDIHYCTASLGQTRGSEFSGPSAQGLPGEVGVCQGCSGPEARALSGGWAGSSSLL